MDTVVVSRYVVSENKFLSDIIIFSLVANVLVFMVEKSVGSVALRI